PARERLCRGHPSEYPRAVESPRGLVSAQIPQRLWRVHHSAVLFLESRPTAEWRHDCPAWPLPQPRPVALSDFRCRATGFAEKAVQRSNTSFGFSYDGESHAPKWQLQEANTSWGTEASSICMVVWSIRNISRAIRFTPLRRSVRLEPSSATT